MNLVDNTHYITSGFGLGALALFTPPYDVYTGAASTLAPDLQVLGVCGSMSVLAALETGGGLYGGGAAAGRRVQVAWGDDFGALNADGQTLMQRSLEWAAVAGGGGGGEACNGSFVDRFDARSFSGDDGTLSWTGDWQEIGESDGPTSGDVLVDTDESDYQLRIRDNNNGGEGVEREADLSGAASAGLGFEYRREGLDEASDYVAVEVSADGAAGPWVEIARLQGPGTDSSYQKFGWDISEFVSSNTRIRFKSSPTMGDNDAVWFDDIQILCIP
jgi:hypothetical protein